MPQDLENTENTNAVPPALRTFKMIISYDGTMYHGWQRQNNGNTVQEVV